MSRLFGILAIGMLLVILNGGIDLSVGSTLGLSGVVAGFLMQGVTLNAFGVVLYPPVWFVAVLACLLGAFIGHDQRRVDPRGSRCRPSWPPWASCIWCAASPSS